VKRALGRVIPTLSPFGGASDEITTAIQLVDHAGSADECVSQTMMRARVSGGFFAQLPVYSRLALEMSLQEESERKAMEGELAGLERAWREAEQIAAIADSLLIPGEVLERIAGLRKESAAPALLSIDYCWTLRFGLGGSSSGDLLCTSSGRTSAIALNGRLGQAGESVLVEADDAGLNGLLGVALLRTERRVILLVARHCKPPPRLTASGWHADLATVRLVAIRELKCLDHFCLFTGEPECNRAEGRADPFSGVLGGGRGGRKLLERARIVGPNEGGEEPKALCRCHIGAAATPIDRGPVS
jgi:hypothetical protein